MIMTIQRNWPLSKGQRFMTKSTSWFTVLHLLQQHIKNNKEYYP